MRGGGVMEQLQHSGMNEEQKISTDPGGIDSHYHPKCRPILSFSMRSNEQFNATGVLHGCHTVTFDSCNNLFNLLIL